jgi:hypothetical protein
MESMTTVDLIFMGFLILMPLWDKKTYQAVLPDLKINKGRIKYYWQVIGYLWLIGLISYGLAYNGYLSITPENLLLDFEFTWTQNLGLVIAFAFYGVTILSLKPIRKKPEFAFDVVTKFGDGSALMPKTKKEGQVFTLVSISAGVWEELIFRGVLYAILSSQFGQWPAIFLSSIFFGWQHYYISNAHVVRTSFVGLFLAILYVYTGSLAVPIIVHIFMDIGAGLQFKAAYAVVEKNLPKASDFKDMKPDNPNNTNNTDNNGGDKNGA